MKAMIIFLVCVLQSAAQLLFAQNTTLEVRDIEKVEGYLYVAIYNSETTFMKKPLTSFRIDVKDKVLSVPCQGLPAGTYAISLFQTRMAMENWILPPLASQRKSMASAMTLKA